MFTPPQTPNLPYISPNPQAGFPQPRTTPPVRTVPPQKPLPAQRPLTGGTWSWFWHFETGSPGKPSSTGTPGRAQVPGLRTSRRIQKGECRSPAPRPSAQPAPSRIQMMTGTAAATFPISSSVCMIFLIRACRRKGTDLVSCVPTGELREPGGIPGEGEGGGGH